MLNYEITEKGVPEAIRRAIHDIVDTMNTDDGLTLDELLGRKPEERRIPA